MSAIDELQRMLDEREVDYTWTDLRRSVPSCEIVQWWSSDDVHAEYIEYHDGSTVLRVHTSMLHATPEQAIAATLGDDDLKAENAKLRAARTESWG